MRLSINTQRRRLWNRKDHRNPTICISVLLRLLNAVSAVRRNQMGNIMGRRENEPP